MGRQNHFERQQIYHIFHVLIVIQRGDLCIFLSCKQGWSDDLVNPRSSVIDWMMMDKNVSFARHVSLWHFAHFNLFLKENFPLTFSNDNKCGHISLFALGSNSLEKNKTQPKILFAVFTFHNYEPGWLSYSRKGKHHETNAIKLLQRKTWGVFLLQLCQLSYHTAGNSCWAVQKETNYPHKMFF